MKNSEELLDKYPSLAPIEFTKALTEHDNELISEIEKKIESLEVLRHTEYFDDEDEAAIIALTEIINLIKEKK